MCLSVCLLAHLATWNPNVMRGHYCFYRQWDCYISFPFQLTVGVLTVLDSRRPPSTCPLCLSHTHTHSNTKSVLTTNFGRRCFRHWDLHGNCWQCFSLMYVLHVPRAPALSRAVCTHVFVCAPVMRVAAWGYGIAFRQPRGERKHQGPPGK